MHPGFIVAFQGAIAGAHAPERLSARRVKHPIRERCKLDSGMTDSSLTSATSQNDSQDAVRPKLMIIIASVRQGRVGLPVGRWFTALAEAQSSFDIDLVDLAELDLPLMDEPLHPRLKQYSHDHTKAWSQRVDSADAFVFVMPEYNYSFSAPLKNALDYLFTEWRHKPLGFVTYGGVSAGTRAMVALQPVLQSLQITSVQPAVKVGS